MKEFIPKGTGNSRFLKSAISAETTWEQFKAMLIAGNAPIDFNGINMGGIQQLGDPLNKNTLAKDATLALYGLGADAVPDDVFQSIRSEAYAKIGDIRQTTRTDLGSNWLLCNGEEISGTVYNGLVNLLSSGSCHTKDVTIGGILSFKYINNQYVALIFNYSAHSTYVYYTSDPTGTSWSTRTIYTGTDYYPSDITYGDGYYVISGAEGYIIYGTSLLGTFTRRNIGTSRNIDKIEYYNGYFMVISTSVTDSWYTTAPYGTWTAITLLDKPYWLSAANGYWFTVSEYDAYNHYLDYATSPAGSWTRVSDRGGYWVDYVNGYYFRYNNNAQKIYYSSTVDFSSQSYVRIPLNKITYCNGYWYGTWANALYRSTSLSANTWEELPGYFHSSGDMLTFESTILGTNNSDELYDFNSDALTLPEISLTGAYAYIKASEQEV